MIGFDTKVLVRHIMQDQPKQAAEATKLVEGLSAKNPGFITILSIVEGVWVLSSSYDLGREQVMQTLDMIFRAKQLVVDQAEHVASALRAFGSGIADFADCLIERSAVAAGCTQTMAFDIAAAKTAGMTVNQ